MIFTVESLERKNKYLSYIREIATTNTLYATRYLDFGTKVIRVLCYSPKIMLFLEQQLCFVLKDEVPSYDETIVFWQSEDIRQIAEKMDASFNPKNNLRLRVEMLACGRKYPDILLIDTDFSKTTPFIRLSALSDAVEAYDANSHTYYLGATKLESEEFIKQGHLFVQQLNVLLKTQTTNLTHGAVFGYNGQGVLLCARGQRGKSTLTVHSLLNGCEYVSDDYQMLEKQGNDLYAYPLYSIITLSPEMYTKMYADFNGKFCSNNARKDKYVFNISAYEGQFKTRYPIKLCLFPEIVLDGEPSIVPCSSEDKGRAIVQLIHSTVMQVRDLNNHDTIKKLFYMVCNLPFYKFNLSHNIAQNTKYLRDFLKQNQILTKEVDLPRYIPDITFDLANILDTKNYTFYSLNKFATNVYEMLLSGVPAQTIAQKLTHFLPKHPTLLDEFNLFVQKLKEYNLLQTLTNTYPEPIDLSVEFMAECGYKLSILVYKTEQTQELISITKG